MNVIRIGLLIIVILSVVFGAVLIYSVNQESEEPITEPSMNNESSETSTILSNTPPGITEYENRTISISTDELLTAHVQELERNSITVNKSVDSTDKTIYRSDDDVVKIEGERMGLDIGKYSTEEYILTKRERFEGEKEYNVDLSDFDSEEYTMNSEFDSLLSDLEIDNYDENDEGNTVLYFKESGDMQSLKTQYGFDSINHIESIIEINADGIIVSSSIDIVGDKDGIRNNKYIDYEIVDIGNTIFTSPEWLSDAENEVSVVAGEYNKDNGWILLEHQGLAEIPAGESIHIVNLETGSSDSVTLPENFDEDDIASLYLDIGGWEIIMNEEPPIRESSNSSQYGLVTGEDVQEYFEITVTDIND